MGIRRAAAAAMAFCVAMGVATNSGAWSEDGHRIIGALAANHLTPHAKSAVQRIIGGAALESECPIASLDDAAEFPDCVKIHRDITAKYQFMRNWHYDNPSKCGTPQDYSTYCAGGQCASSAIASAYSTLKAGTASAHDQLLALAQLAHFVGDLHQPLHVSDQGDIGGNDIKISYLGKVDSQDPSLHHAWDKTLVLASVGPKAPAVPKLDPEMGKGGAPKQNIADVRSWANASFALAMNDAYGKVPYTPHCPVPAKTAPPLLLNQAYADNALPIVHKQLVLGASRLAGLLNAAFP